MLCTVWCLFLYRSSSHFARTVLPIASNSWLPGYVLQADQAQLSEAMLALRPAEEAYSILPFSLATLSTELSH
jgi:hypothetical protein